MDNISDFYNKQKTYALEDEDNILNKGQKPVVTIVKTIVPKTFTHTCRFMKFLKFETVSNSNFDDVYFILKMDKLPVYAHRLANLYLYLEIKNYDETTFSNEKLSDAVGDSELDFSGIVKYNDLVLKSIIEPIDDKDKKYMCMMRDKSQIFTHKIDISSLLFLNQNETIHNSPNIYFKLSGKNKFRSVNLFLHFIQIAKNELDRLISTPEEIYMLQPINIVLNSSEVKNIRINHPIIMICAENELEINGTYKVCTDTFCEYFGITSSAYRGFENMDFKNYRLKGNGKVTLFMITIGVMDKKDINTPIRYKTKHELNEFAFGYKNLLMPRGRIM